MRAISRTSLSLGLMLSCGLAFAQQPPPGWQLGWGASPVPLSPWASALIVILLAITAYAFMKRHARTGLMALFGALLAGGALQNADIDAHAVAYDYTITTSTGSTFVSCGLVTPGNAGMAQAQNGLDGPIVGVTQVVTINEVTPVNWGVVTPPNLNDVGYCKPGLKLTPGDSCLLPCQTVT